MKQPIGRYVPTAGVIAASTVLLATSAAAPVQAPRVPEQDRPVAGGLLVPHGIDGMPRLPTARQATGAVETAGGSGPVVPAIFSGNIPATMLDAYRRARDVVDSTQPGCRLPLELLEAIGKVETNHARNGLVDANGTTPSPILGPALNGNGFAAISDTDGGRLDGDPVWDHAVGPMQFLPGTWAKWSADGNGDHRADPNNAYDASLAAARYLCAANRDLAAADGLAQAIDSYNDSTSYRNLVLSWMSYYANGTIVVPDASTVDSDAPAPAIPATLGSPPETAPPTQPAPAKPPTGTPAPPTTATPPPTTPPPPTSPPPAEPVCDPTSDATGLVGGLLGGLLGALTGGDQDSACDSPTPTDGQ